jgi:hypothetical protein
LRESIGIVPISTDLISFSFLWIQRESNKLPCISPVLKFTCSRGSVDLSKHVTLYWQQMATGGGRGNLYGAKYAAFFL